MLKNVKIKNMDIRSIKKILSKKGFFVAKNSLLKKQSSLHNIYKISWTNDSEKSLIYLKRNL